MVEVRARQVTTRPLHPERTTAIGIETIPGNRHNAETGIVGLTIVTRVASGGATSDGMTRGGTTATATGGTTGEVGMTIGEEVGVMTIDTGATAIADFTTGGITTAFGAVGTTGAEAVAGATLGAAGDAAISAEEGDATSADEGEVEGAAIPHGCGRRTTTMERPHTPTDPPCRANLGIRRRLGSTPPRRISTHPSRITIPPSRTHIPPSRILISMPPHRANLDMPLSRCSGRTSISPPLPSPDPPKIPLLALPPSRLQEAPSANF